MKTKCSVTEELSNPADQKRHIGFLPSEPTFCAYAFTLESLEHASLPGYTGSTLRGSLGHSLLRLNCSQDTPVCQSCQSASKCPYLQIFGARSSGEGGCWQSSNIPHPFVIEPPLVHKETYRPGDTLTFRLILVGDGTSHLIDIITAFSDAALTGLGKERARFRLTRVVDAFADKKRAMYDGKSLRLNGEVICRSFKNVTDEVCRLNARQLRIFFLTPTRLKRKDLPSQERTFEFVTELRFPIFVRALLRRLSWLAEAHCGEKWNIDHTGLLAKAETIRTTESDLHWHDMQRYSARQDTKIHMGGVVGRVCFEGDLREFLPFVKMGEYLHVGQGTVLGLGKYMIEPTDSSN